MNNIKARARILGKFDVRGLDGDQDDSFELGMVLEFRTAEDVRAALKAGVVEFGFPDYPDEPEQKELTLRTGP